MTYQIGAENLIDPYIDDALVSLSELRDARFSKHSLFACGRNFVIGESLSTGEASIPPSPAIKQPETQMLMIPSPSPAKLVQAMSPMKK